MWERRGGGEQHEQVRERSREREQESEGKGASTLNCEWLTTLSEQKVLLHALSVYWSAARDCAFLCFPHLPPLPAYQHQPSAASSSWLRRHPESKGVNETCEPRGMRAATEPIWATQMTRNTVTQENSEQGSSLYILFCFFVFPLRPSLKSWLSAWMDLNLTSQWFLQAMDDNTFWQIFWNLSGRERRKELKTDYFKKEKKRFLLIFFFRWLSLLPSDRCSRGLRRSRRDRAHADRGTCTSYHLAESYLDSFSFWLFHLKRTKTL